MNKMTPFIAILCLALLSPTLFSKEESADQEATLKYALKLADDLHETRMKLDSVMFLYYRTQEHNSNLQRKADALRQERDQLKKKEDMLTDTITMLRNNCSYQDSLITDQSQALASLGDRLISQDTEIQLFKSVIKDLRAKNDTLEAETKELREKVLEVKNESLAKDLYMYFTMLTSGIIFLTWIVKKYVLRNNFHRLKSGIHTKQHSDLV